MLHFPILVNGRPIGYVKIRRLHALVQGQPSEYEVNVEYPMHEGHPTTRVLHDYDDGALVLIQKALANVEAMKHGDVP